MDSGAPISYQVLEKGTPVYSMDGTLVGSVVHVLAAEDEDVFDGIVIKEHSREPGDHRLGSHEHDDHRFADADDIATLHEHAVTLKLSATACAELPRPTANPAVMREDPADPTSSGLGSKLHRAWSLLSGDY
jgi:hypothetical protein